MKIVSVVGSCRQSGNTEQVVKLFEEKLAEFADKQQIPLEIEHILLSKKNVASCRGCRVCFDKGEEFCPSKDDVLSIRGQIAAADALILASPVYVDDISGVMKNWIDRMAFICHRPALFGKSAAVIATSGSFASNQSLRTMANALTSWGARVITQNKFQTGALMEQKQLRDRYGAAAAKAAKRLFDAVRSGTVQQPSFYSLVAFSVQKKTHQMNYDGHSVDSAYWKSNGWLEPSRKYYTKENPNPIKSACARVIACIVMKFFMS